MKRTAPGQAVPEPAEQFGRGQGDAQVKIVAAGVHHPVHRGAPGDLDLFLEGQGVHIGPVGHAAAGPGAFQVGHHAAAGEAGAHRQT